MSISLVDSHCHIPMIEVEGGADAIIQSALDNDIHKLLCVCVVMEDLPAILELASRHDAVLASAGVHPNTELETEISVGEIVEAASHERVVAIGETGLDYFRSQGDLAWQRDRFRRHIQAAKEINKPIIVHCRDAKDDVIRLLKEERADEVGGVMHCFVEDLETARRAIDLNFAISFSGILTFKNAGELKEVARQLPLESILVETDSPYLAPVPYRGKQNQPAYVRHVAEHIADLRGISLAQVAAQTTKNFNRLFIN